MMFMGIILIIALLYLARQQVPSVNPSYQKRNALEVLRERYARGEMDASEFRARKEELLH